MRFELALGLLLLASCASAPNEASNSYAGVNINATTEAGIDTILITLIVPYYNQHKLIYNQFRRWSEYPEDAQRQMEVVIVDDGSTRQPLESVFKEAVAAGDMPAIMPVKGVTLDKDIGFNHGGACNTVSAGVPSLFNLDLWPTSLNEMLGANTNLGTNEMFS